MTYFLLKLEQPIGEAADKLIGISLKPFYVAGHVVVGCKWRRFHKS